jgi:HD-GYP domain-containing protein (c-di-GMP phosphodiesterase class II)
MRDHAGRSALSVKAAVQMIQDERGHHFDPELLDAAPIAVGSPRILAANYPACGRHGRRC